MVTSVYVCVCVFSKMCAGPTRRPVRAGPCCPAGTLTARRAAVLSLSTAAAEATGITLSQRSTACLCAAASVSPDLDRQLAASECRSFQSLVLSLTLTFTDRLSELSTSLQTFTAVHSVCFPVCSLSRLTLTYSLTVCLCVCVCLSDNKCLH